MEVCKKPIVSVPIFTSEKDKSLINIEGSKYGGVFFETPERAVSSLARMHEYRQFFAGRDV
jgi:hypothetical protein